MRCGDGRLGRPTEISMRWYEAVGTKLRLLQPQRPPHHARRTMPAAPCPPHHARRTMPLVYIVLG
jgi:hypothetical protein